MIRCAFASCNSCYTFGLRGNSGAFSQHGLKNLAITPHIAANDLNCETAGSVHHAELCIAFDFLHKSRVLAQSSLSSHALVVSCMGLRPSLSVRL